MHGKMVGNYRRLFNANINVSGSDAGVVVELQCRLNPLFSLLLFLIYCSICWLIRGRHMHVIYCFLLLLCGAVFCGELLLVPVVGAVAVVLGTGAQQPARVESECLGRVVVLPPLAV